MKTNIKSVRISSEKLSVIENILEKKMRFSQFINILIDEFLRSKNVNIQEKMLDPIEKDSIVKVVSYLSKKEFEALFSSANYNSSSISREARRRIVSTINNKKLIDNEEKKIINELSKQLVKIGTNINGITRYYNQKYEESIELNSEQVTYIKELTEKLSEELKEINKILLDIKKKCL